MSPNEESYFFLFLARSSRATHLFTWSVLQSLRELRVVVVVVVGVGVVVVCWKLVFEASWGVFRVIFGKNCNDDF